MIAIDASRYSFTPGMVGTKSLAEWFRRAWELCQQAQEHLSNNSPRPLFILGLWDGVLRTPHASRILQLALDAGWDIAAYTAVIDHSFLVPSQQIVRPLEELDPLVRERLLFVALDFEISPVSQAFLSTAIATTKATGHQPVIYTSRGFWNSHVENPTLEVPGVPLWDASWVHYEPNPKTVPPFLPAFLPPFVPYGPWVERVGHQYLPDTKLLNVNVDVSLFEDTWLLDIQKNETQKEEPMLPNPINSPEAQDLLSNIQADLLTCWVEYSFAQPIAEVLAKSSNPLGDHLISGGKYLKLALNRVERALGIPNDSLTGGP